MRLYHYTRAVWLAPIRQRGIERRCVPNLPDGGVWLSDDHRWYKQAWAGDLAYRIAVDVPDDDPMLVRWPELAKQLAVSDSEYEALHQTGGKQSHRWWVYLGAIETDRITEVMPRPGGAAEEEHDATGVAIACLLCLADLDDIKQTFDTDEAYREHYLSRHQGDPKMSLLAARGVARRKRSGGGQGGGQRPSSR